MSSSDMPSLEPDIRLPKTKLWDGVVVLECVCGLAVDYPGHPDEVETSTCASCGTTYGLVER